MNPGGVFCLGYRFLFLFETPSRRDLGIFWFCLFVVRKLTFQQNPLRGAGRSTIF